MRRIGLFGLVLGLLAIPYFWAPTVADAAEAATIKQAASHCRVAKSKLADQGKTLELDTVGDEDFGVGVPIEKVACVLVALKTPAYVVSEIDNTRALDGMQKAHWGSYRASWTYHPDDGLSIIIYEP